MVQLPVLNGTSQAGGSAICVAQAAGGWFTGGTTLIWMLSTGGCTNTVVGGLVAPKAEAVTWTTPTPAGVHTL